MEVEDSPMWTETDGVLDAALTYAGRGWPVFPCLPGGKEPATRHGFHDASTDPGQIEYWWTRRPHANVAIATGAPGPDVLDVDQHGPAGNGYAAYCELGVAGLLDQMLAVVTTPRGGLHAYFTGTGQASARLVRHHLDFRAAGGYVVAPPSQVGGKRYRFGRQYPRTGVLNWTAVVAILGPSAGQSHRYGVSRTDDVSGLIAWVGRLEEGNRNCGLFWAACRAIEDGHADGLGDMAEAAASTGLPAREIARTIASARRTARPRGDSRAA